MRRDLIHYSREQDNNKNRIFIFWRHEARPHTLFKRTRQQQKPYIHFLTGAMTFVGWKTTGERGKTILIKANSLSLLRLSIWLKEVHKMNSSEKPMSKSTLDRSCATNKASAFDSQIQTFEHLVALCWTSLWHSHLVSCRHLMATLVHPSSNAGLRFL